MAETPTPRQRGIRLPGQMVPGHHVRTEQNPEAEPRGITPFQEGRRMAINGPLRVATGGGYNTIDGSTVWTYSRVVSFPNAVQSCGACGNSRIHLHRLQRNLTDPNPSCLDLCDACIHQHLNPPVDVSTTDGTTADTRDYSMETWLPEPNELVMINGPHTTVSSTGHNTRIPNSGAWRYRSRNRGPVVPTCGVCEGAASSHVLESPTGTGLQVFICESCLIEAAMDDVPEALRDPQTPAAEESWPDGGTPVRIDIQHTAIVSGRNTDIIAGGCHWLYAYRTISTVQNACGVCRDVVSGAHMLNTSEHGDTMLFLCDGCMREAMSEDEFDTSPTYTRDQEFTTIGTLNVRSETVLDPFDSDRYSHWRYNHYWGDQDAAVLCSSCGAGQDLVHRLVAINTNHDNTIFIDLCGTCMTARCDPREAPPTDATIAVGHMLHIQETVVGLRENPHGDRDPASVVGETWRYLGHHAPYRGGQAACGGSCSGTGLNRPHRFECESGGHNHMLQLCGMCVNRYLQAAANVSADDYVRQEIPTAPPDPVGTDFVGDGLSVGDVVTLTDDDGVAQRQTVTGINPTTFGDVAGITEGPPPTAACGRCAEIRELPVDWVDDDDAPQRICETCWREVTNGDELPETSSHDGQPDHASTTPRPRAEMVVGGYRCERCNEAPDAVLRLDTTTTNYLCLSCVAVMLEGILPSTFDEVEENERRAEEFHASPSATPTLPEEFVSAFDAILSRIQQLPAEVAERVLSASTSVRLLPMNLRSDENTQAAREAITELMRNQTPDQVVMIPAGGDLRGRVPCYCCDTITANDDVVNILQLGAAGPTISLCHLCYIDNYHHMWPGPPTEEPGSDNDPSCGWCTHERTPHGANLPLPDSETTLRLCTTCYQHASTETHYCNPCQSMVKVTVHRTYNAEGQALRTCMVCRGMIIATARFNRSGFVDAAPPDDDPAA